MKMGCLGVIGLVVLIIIVSVATSGGDDVATSGNSADSNEASSSEGKKEEKKAYGVGEEVPVEELTYTVNSVEQAEEFSNSFDSLQTEGKFLVVDITVQNNDKEARFIDGEMFRVLDADGTEFSAKSEADMYINDDMGFFLSEVNPKMSKTGKVAFEVPAETGELQLQVSSGFGFSGGKTEVINLQ